MGRDAAEGIEWKLEKMVIRYAAREDLPLLAEHDRHISQDELQRSIGAKHVLLLFDGENFAGWLRYNLFWDNLPFMNMLYFLEEYRGKGYGGQLTAFWEREMTEKDYTLVLTSTLSSERGQDFFRKHGYVDCGSLLLPDEPLEIILRKDLKQAPNL